VNNPDLKIELDMGLDQWTGNTFLSFDEKDIFSNSILRDHPNLTECKSIDKETRKECINNYVSGYYIEHQKELDRATETCKKHWLEVSSKFFDLADKLFSENGNGYTWLDGPYACYLSIFNCNPRFIKNKYFQAFYKHKETVNYVCMHEFLHFAFYEYMERVFPKDFKRLGEDGMWKLSEIFNDVVLRQPDFVDVTKQSNPAFYAEKKEDLDRYITIWESNPEVNLFVKEYLKAL
jgi:hypothetical protein